MSEHNQEAAIEGWYTMDSSTPHLLGTQCAGCGTYYFPKQSNFCRNPACQSEEFNEVELSRTGTIWSYTNACYQPPEPYISPDPYEPFAIAAVALEKEQMIILGQLVKGVELTDIKIGDPVELVLETLYQELGSDKVVWKWKPVRDA